MREREGEMRKVRKKNIFVRWKKNSLDRWTEKEREREKSRKERMEEQQTKHKDKKKKQHRRTFEKESNIARGTGNHLFIVEDEREG